MKKVKVLLVNRNEKFGKNLIKALTSESSIQVLDQATNGYEAITKVLRMKPDIVLMNVNMETTMAAASACKEITASSPSTSVILFGKTETDEIIFKAFQMGAVNFLVEDYTMDDLVQAVLDASCQKSSIHFSAAKKLSIKLKTLMGMEDNLTYVLNVLTQLTPAELNILKLVYSGMRYQEVAKVLFISTSTMKTHVSHILKKFNLENLSQVMELLRATGLFSIITITNNNFE